MTEKSKVIMRTARVDVCEFLEEIEIVFNSKLNYEKEHFGSNESELSKEAYADYEEVKVKLETLRALGLIFVEEMDKLNDYFFESLQKFLKGGDVVENPS